MQNLPITTAQPITPAQASTPANNNTAQAAEPFGNVLARQRANSDEPNTDTRDKGQTTSSTTPSSSTDDAPATIGNEPGISIPVITSMLPGDMLAALLPAPASTKNASAKDKPAPQAPTPDGASMLPGDMLAALLSTPPAIQGTSAATRQQHNAVDGPGDTRQQLVAADIQGGTRQQLIAADIQGGTRQQLIAAGMQESAQQSASTGQTIGEQAAASLPSAQGNTKPAIAATDTQGKTFSAALETSGKGASNTTLSAGAKQISAQDALPAIPLAGMTQSTASPTAASQSGPIQVAVNTPVTHGAWGDEFNQKITWLATQHEQTAELHLNPPHLGPLDVVLKINGDQATALFTSPHAAVRDAVEQALPKLREMLADNGIMLGNAMVNDQATKEQWAGLAGKQPGGNGGLSGKAGDGDLPASAVVWPARRHQGMVDTFA